MKLHVPPVFDSPRHMSTFLGIEIGGTKLQIVAGDDSANILSRKRFTVASGSGAEGIRQQIASALPSFLKEWQPAAIGMGFGGPVDGRTGCIARSHQVEGWSGFRMAEWLRELSRLAVVVENDSNAATFAEATRGAGAGHNPVFYFNLGSGVGGGLVVDGKIYHGQAPGEAEFGHVRLDKSGVTVEDRCSGWAVDARIRQFKASGVKSLLCEQLPATPGGEAKLLPQALAAGDEAAHQLIREVAGDLAFALSHVTHLFHPEVIVLGGGLSLIGEPLRSAVAAALPRLVMEVFHGGPPIKLSALGEDAVPVGALLLAQSAR